MCGIFSAKGYWVHFISADARGSQPFDVIAVKDGKPIVFDCKTCKDKIFRIGRLEDNQVMAFEKWLSAGNPMPYVAVEHESCVYMIEYGRLKEAGKIDLRKEDAVWHISADKVAENVGRAENVKKSPF